VGKSAAIAKLRRLRAKAQGGEGSGALAESAGQGEKEEIMTHMPFGKFKGEALVALPPDYIEWLLEQEFVKDPLRAALVHLVGSSLTSAPPEDDEPIRDANPIPIKVDIPDRILRSYIRAIVLEGFRAVKRKHDDPSIKTPQKAPEYLSRARELMEAAFDL
jgi:putative quorum-sensing-regulated virulence factor